jgi:YbbR domain-containing protein
MRDQNHESFGRRVWSRVRRYLFEDARLKLLALLIVTVIWFGVAGQTRDAPITIRNLSVALENVPPQLAITSSEPAQVDITVSGPEDELRDLRFEVATQSSDLLAFADLANLTEGVQLPQLKVRGLPEGVTLHRVEPNTVRVTLDPIETRSVPVDPLFAGTPPDGYKVTSVRFEPEVVTLSGPQSVIGKIERVTTTTVSLNNRSESFSEDVDVDVTGTEVVVLERPKLHVTIEEDVGSRTFTVPVVVDSDLGGVADPQTVEVTLKGPLPALDALKPSEISATVDPSLAVGSRGVVPQIRLTGPHATRVEVERVVPQTVRLRR